MLRYICASAFLILVVFGFGSNSVLAVRTPWQLWGKVDRVADGDTVLATVYKVNDPAIWAKICRKKNRPNGPCKIRVRLKDVDAPEWGRSIKRRQPFGQKSREYLKSLVLGKEVHFKAKNMDRYKRVLAILYVAGEDINKKMVCQGMAVVYKYSRNKDYRECQKKARHAKKGFWILGRNFVDPYTFRKKRNRKRK